ncbi:MAG: type II toxin-antitoxin system RatA family toxin [Alphaproteobacteria bacterium]|nr:type II toxin-antitoxin system RatA family toxin [Alphaproteobacteria bacterium]
MQHQETRLLPYSADQMFDLVASIERYPEFLPWCKDSRIVSRGKDSVTADLIVGYKLFREKFTSEVTLNRPQSIEVRYSSGPLSRLSTLWQFTPVAKRGRGKNCELSFQLDFDLRSPLLRATMFLFFDKALTKMATAFEERARILYG